MTSQCADVLIYTNYFGLFIAVETCPNGYKLNPFSKTCIRLVQIPKTWEDAKNYCEVAGEYLATFETSDSANWFIHHRLTDPGKKNISL